MSTTWSLVLLATFTGVFYHVISRRKFYWLSWHLPGPLTIPIIGNALTFFCKDEDIFEEAIKIVSKYSSPMRFWFGTKLAIIFSESEQAAKILTSVNFINKDAVYNFMKIINGDGLISGSGLKWRKDRKLMAPLFLKQNIDEYFPCIIHHTKILIEKLEDRIDQPVFNIGKYLHRCAADFVNESILGVKTNAQNGTLDRFLNAVNRGYVFIHARIVKVWLQVEWIFKLTHYWQEQKYIKKEVHGFLRSVLEGVNERRRTGKITSESLLDKILDIKERIPDFATEEQLIHHLSTLYTASEDTVTTIAAFTLLLLGMYPKIQNKVIEEIDQLFDDKHEMDLDDLAKLTYLEMCIKDVLRLFPIAPFIMRVSCQDFSLDKWIIPKGCSVIVSIHNIHRDPKYWDKPNEFNPEHFLPESIEKRHAYTFLPFSTGPRGCLGKQYAYMALKIILTLVLKKYKIHADGNIEDIKLRTDISVRAKDDQYPIRIERRTLNKI